MESFEKVFLGASAIVLVVFLCALGYSTAGMSIHLPSEAGEIYCTATQKLRKVLRKTPPFDNPGVREVAPGKYEAVIIGQTWAFTPDEIDLPAGSDVTFIATSADVVHGFLIPGTRVNMMLIPGKSPNSTTASASRANICSFAMSTAAVCIIRCPAK